jgi:hypothetical protein
MTARARAQFLNQQLNNTAASAARKILKARQSEGVTLNGQGQAASITGGYMVSVKGHEVRLPGDSEFREVVRAVRQHIRKISAGQYLGAWFSDGQLVLDISVNIQGLEDALVFGRNNEQEMIYNAGHETNGKPKYISCK